MPRGIYLGPVKTASQWQFCSAEVKTSKVSQRFAMARMWRALQICSVDLSRLTSGERVAEHGCTLSTGNGDEGH